MHAAERFGGTPVRTVDELEAIVGVPEQRAIDKVRRSLHPRDKDWLAASSLCFIATSGTAGDLDVSPKGDPAGFALVLDDTTIAIPDRPGNRRVDGFRNLLVNPHIGINFLIPGRGDTLRINGRATIVSEAPFLSAMEVRGHHPALALVIEIDEIFFHCSKAFLRSKAWDPESWRVDAAPSRAAIARDVERPDADLAALEEYYGPSYGDRIYG